MRILSSQLVLVLSFSFHPVAVWLPRTWHDNTTGSFPISWAVTSSSCYMAGGCRQYRENSSNIKLLQGVKLNIYRLKRYVISKSGKPSRLHCYSSLTSNIRRSSVSRYTKAGIQTVSRRASGEQGENPGPWTKACPQSVTCLSNKSIRKWLWGAGRNQYHMCSLRNEKLELPARWTLPSAHVWWNVSGVRAADSFRVFRVLGERISRDVNHRLVVFFNALGHLHGDGKSVCCGQSIGVNVSLHTYTYAGDMLHRGHHRMSKLAHSRPTVGSCGWTVGLWLITDDTGQWVLVF